MHDLNRREFVTATAVAVACACVVCAADETPTASGTLDVGALSDFKEDKVYDRFAPKPNMVLLVRANGRLYAMTSRCTHRNCALKLDNQSTIYCPCHKSRFSHDGIVEKGPAKTSLARYAISADDKGHVIVDRSKQFAEKEWDSAGSFIEVKK